MVALLVVRLVVGWWNGGPRSTVRAGCDCVLLAKVDMEYSAVGSAEHCPTESLEELAELTSKLFSPIPNRGRDALPMITQHPFGPKEVGVSIFLASDLLITEISSVDPRLSSNYHVIPCHGNLLPFRIPTTLLATQTGAIHLPFPWA